MIRIVDCSAHPAMDRARWETVDGLERSTGARASGEEVGVKRLEIVAPEAEKDQNADQLPIAERTAHLEESDEPDTDEFPRVKNSRPSATPDETEEILRAYLEEMAASEAKYQQQGNLAAKAIPKHHVPAPDQDRPAVNIFLGQIRERTAKPKVEPPPLVSRADAAEEDTRALQRHEADELISHYNDEEAPHEPAKDCTPTPPAFPLGSSAAEADDESTRSVDQSEADELLKAFADFSTTSQPADAEATSTTRSPETRAEESLLPEAQLVSGKPVGQAIRVPVLEIPDSFLGSKPAETTSANSGQQASPRPSGFSPSSHSDVTKRHSAPSQVSLVAKASTSPPLDEDHTPNLTKSDADELLKGFSGGQREVTKKRLAMPSADFADDSGDQRYLASGDPDQTPPSGFRASEVHEVTKKRPTAPPPGEPVVSDTPRLWSASNEDLDQTPARGFHAAVQAVTRRRPTPPPPGEGSVSATDSSIPEIDLVVPDGFDDPRPEVATNQNAATPTVGEKLVVPDVAEHSAGSEGEDDVEESWILEDYESTKALDQKQAQELLKDFQPDSEDL